MPLGLSAWRRLGWRRGLIALLLGTLGGAGAFTAVYAQGLSYLSDDPQVCTNCHVMREHFDGWQKASHHGVATCNDCHLPHHHPLARLAVKAENGFWHSARFTLQDFAEPIRARPTSRDVVLSNCARCHAGLVAHLRDQGAEEPGGPGCLRCHDAVGHGPTR